MHWAEYRSNSNKAKLHLGFDLNHGIPRKLFLTEGKGAERPFVSSIIDPGQTAVLDRGYQAHLLFDQWQSDGCHFVCRIKGITQKEVQEEYPLPENSYIFRDAKVLLGTSGVNQTQQPVRLVGYTVDDKTYWIATDRFDLTAEQVAFVYKLRWDIEKFFSWWKRHLKCLSSFCQKQERPMVQILSGLITYLPLAIYCHESHGHPQEYSKKEAIDKEGDSKIHMQFPNRTMLEYIEIFYNRERFHSANGYMSTCELRNTTKICLALCPEKC